LANEPGIFRVFGRRSFMFSKDLREIRFHGRGGQGAVLSATLAAEVAFRMGYYPQAFPFFGAERRGAPVMAFLRYSSSFLMPRSRIYNHDYIVVFDPELPWETFREGLKEGGVILVNANSDLGLWSKELSNCKVHSIDASRIAAGAGLISSGMPLVSSVMLGALVKILEIAPFHILEECLERKIPQWEKNISVARRGFLEVKEVRS
jgi:pyruvate ferredoxin oxidoreductase gamma subunit